MPVSLGETLACRKCQKSFVCSHPRQRYCTPRCERRAAEAREPRKLKQKERNRRWREAHAAERKEKRKAWYQQNREKVAAQQKIYRSKLPPETVLARRNAYYAAHKARQKKRYHQTRAWLPWQNALQGSKQRARKNNIAFTITPEWAAARWTGKCEVSGLEFVLSTKRSPYLFSPSIDRIIPSLGYTPENSRFVLHAVNALKGAGTDQDMLHIARAIIQYNQ